LTDLKSFMFNIFIENTLLPIWQAVYYYYYELLILYELLIIYVQVVGSR
jgi:hypothetical protein